MEADELRELLVDGGALVVTFVEAGAHPALLRAELDTAAARGGIVSAGPWGAFVIRHA